MSSNRLFASSTAGWGYGLCAPEGVDGARLLAERDLTLRDVKKAIAELERTEGVSVRTIIGINDDGVFGVERANWRPDLPDAYARPLMPVLWIQIAELLGRAPLGSEARLLEDAALSAREANRAWQSWAFASRLEPASSS